MAVRGGDEATEPNRTNIVTENNWGEDITGAIETARGRGHDAALPELKKQKTGKGTDNSKSTGPTRLIPHNHSKG